MAEIFISYSRKDSTYVKKLARFLREDGFTVWFDDHVEPGDFWWDDIEREIRQAVIIIVVVSRSTQDSRWVKRESLLADKLGKAVFPLSIDGEVWTLQIDRQHETISDGRMPSNRFLNRLRSEVEISTDFALSRSDSRLGFAYELNHDNGLPPLIDVSPSLRPVAKHNTAPDPTLIIVAVLVLAIGGALLYIIAESPGLTVHGGLVATLIVAYAFATHIDHETNLLSTSGRQLIALVLLVLCLPFLPIVFYLIQPNTFLLRLLAVVASSIATIAMWLGATSLLIRPPATTRSLPAYDDTVSSLMFDDSDTDDDLVLLDFAPLSPPQKKRKPSSNSDFDDFDFDDTDPFGDDDFGSYDFTFDNDDTDPFGDDDFGSYDFTFDDDDTDPFGGDDLDFDDDFF